MEKIRQNKRLWQVIVIIASLALLITSFLPVLTLLK